MKTLIGLKGTDGKEVDALWITKAEHVELALNNSIACTSAGSNGAINIYHDDEYFIRCEAQRYCVTQDEQKFQLVDDAVKWTKKWLKKIQ